MRKPLHFRYMGRLVTNQQKCHFSAVFASFLLAVWFCIHTHAQLRILKFQRVIPIIFLHIKNKYVKVKLEAGQLELRKIRHEAFESLWFSLLMAKYIIPKIANLWNNPSNLASLLVVEFMLVYVSFSHSYNINIKPNGMLKWSEDSRKMTFLLISY